MQLKDIHSQELLPEFASDVIFAANAFDEMMRYAANRTDCLPAPLTLESALELTDEEQAAYFEQYGLAKYYPDISHDKRSWMLWMQNKLWRYLGTPHSIETLCSYLFDEIPVRLKIYDNLAFDAHGQLIDESLIDVFYAELSVEKPSLPSGVLERIKANIIRFVRNQEWMRAFIFLFEAMDTTTGVSITDGERYARDYLIDLYSDDTLPIDLRLGTFNNIGVSRDFSVTPFPQYGFLLDFEDWETSTGYDTEYNITKDGLTIKAIGRVIGFTSTTSPYPISGSRSFVLNGGQSYNNYIIISGLQGVGTFSMKWVPWKDGNGDPGTAILVSDGTTTERVQVPYYEEHVNIFDIRFNNPLAQSILISPVQTTQRNARIRIDDIRF